jgi:hypothetical protein
MLSLGGKFLPFENAGPTSQPVLAHRHPQRSRAAAAPCQDSARDSELEGA